MPRILYLTPFWPGGSSIGARVRSQSILRLLQRVGDVDQVVLDNGERGGEEDNAKNSAVAFSVPVEDLPRRNVAQKLRWSVDPEYPFSHGYRVTPPGVERMLPRLASYDLVWFFKLHAADGFPAGIAWPPSVVDIDDIPSAFEKSRFHSASTPFERLHAFRNRFAWRRRERLLDKRFRVLSVCSEPDRDYLRQLGITAPIHVIPNGFDLPSHPPVHCPSTPPRIGFLGFLDYLPNREGLIWFLERCWPRVAAAIPEARLRLVGKGSDGLQTLQIPGVDALGWLADPDAEMQTWSHMIVPIRVGAGTRVKVAHAFSQKCPVVSTTLGAFGYGAVSGQELLLADSPEEFADACIHLIRNPEEADRMAARAWQNFLEHWSWDAIQPAVSSAVEDCLGITGASGVRNG